MHRRLGSATLSQLAFSGESDPNFPWETSQWDSTVVEREKKRGGGGDRARESYISAIREMGNSMTEEIVHKLATDRV